MSGKSIILFPLPIISLSGLVLFCFVFFHHVIRIRSLSPRAQSWKGAAFWLRHFPDVFPTWNINGSFISRFFGSVKGVCTSRLTTFFSAWALFVAKLSRF